MKLLVLACALLAAEAAKLQGYNVPRPGPPGVPLPTPSGLQTSVLTASAGSQQHGLLTSGGQVHEHSEPSFAGPGQQIALGSSGHFHPSGSGHLSVSEHISVNNIPGGVATSGLSGDFSSQTDIDVLQETCPEGQVRHVDGTCVTPEVRRNVFLYAAPAQEPRAPLPPVNIPLPKEEHSIIFIRTPEGVDEQEPIIIPPPQKKNIIYVLNKESEIEGPKVIEVPAPETKNPEVYFVNYADGEPPSLPDGIDFETALNSAIHAEGQVISGGSGIAPFDGSPSGVGIVAVGPSSSGLALVVESDDSDEVLISGHSGTATLGVSSGAPQTFVNEHRFAGGLDSGIVGPSAGISQTQTSIVAPVSQGFSDIAAGPSSAAFQAPASNIGATPERLYSAP